MTFDVNPNPVNIKHLSLGELLFVLPPCTLAATLKMEGNLSLNNCAAQVTAMCEFGEEISNWSRCKAMVYGSPGIAP
jgi:hypothetical protein